MKYTGDIEELVRGIAAAQGFSGEIRRDEPMAEHTSFKVGGPADLWVRPLDGCFPDFAAALLEQARARDIPLFILGGGANLVAADRGIRGIVLDTTGWTGCDFSEVPGSGGQAVSMRVLAGTPVDQAADTAAAHGWGGLEFLAVMPGAVGGAVWINARCYGKQISDTLLGAEILDENLRRAWVPRSGQDFGYKRSPCQQRDVLIVAAEFRLEKRSEETLRAEMAAFRKDREEKGHYRFPSAGSVFKNNHAAGKPAGQIIDELGLCGFRVGGAQVAPWHGNIIINTGGATAADIRRLTELLQERVKRETGFDLEREIIFIR